MLSEAYQRIATLSSTVLKARFTLGVPTEPSTLVQKFFGSATKTLSRNYTKRNVFRLCLFGEKLRFIHFAPRTSVKSNK